MKKITKLITALLVATIYSNSLNAQVNVGGGTSATYSTVNDAFNAINQGIHTGAITIDITGNTTEPSTPIPLLASGQATANYTSIDIRPTITATISGNMVTGRGILEFDGADNVTINGDISGGAVGKDLSIVHTGSTTIANTACVRLIGRTTLGLGATNFSLLNTIIWGNSDGANTAAPLTSSFGFYAGTNVVNITTTGLGDNYDNLTITNNEFKRSYQAIYSGNTVTNPGDNSLINNNIIGSATPAEYVHFRGINLSSVNNGTVSGNDISNLRISSSASNAGIEINGTASNNMFISANKVYSVYSTSTGGWGAWGINCTNGTNHTIVNNVIYDIMGNNYLVSTTFNAFGIRLTAGTGYKVYYNSVNLFGDMSTITTFTGGVSAAFLVTGTAVTGDVRNNIFCNQMTSSASNVTTKRFMAVWMPTGYNFTNMNFNNNAYMVSPANTTDYFVGKLGTTVGTFEYQTLATWQVASQTGNPTNDVNSVPVVNALPPFISNTNLNFAANAVTPIESGALTLTVLGTPNKDHNSTNRPAGGTNPNTSPDIGAYEFDGLAGIPNDVGIVAINAPAALQCLGASVPVVVTIRNFGTNTITAGVNIPVSVVLSGAANQTITSSYVVGGAGFAPLTNVQYTLAGTLNMSAAGVYSLLATTSMTMPMDNNGANNSSAATRTNVALTTIPINHPFTGFTGANLNVITPNGWNEAQGATFPLGTTGNFLSQTNLNVPGNITARINLLGNTKRDWIVGPKFVTTATTMVSFDAAITGPAVLTAGSNMGSDDQVQLMISTDCGATYVPIFTVSATNSLTTNFTNFSIPLSAYPNQEVIIGFFATEGLVDDIENYDFHLDNINIYNLVPIDAGVSSFISPATTGCYSSTQTVTAVLSNYGTNTLTNIPISVSVTGATTSVLTTTFTGSLVPSTSVAINVGVLNMSIPGTFNFKGYSSMPGDGNNLNDTTFISRTVNPLVTLPISNNFNGFTGANLPTAQANWSEGLGTSVASGTTSTWLSQTNLNGAGNITARLNLLAISKNDWIVSPRTLVTASTQLTFDAALTGAGSTVTTSKMGNDDMVRVMISTNCGASYTPVFTLNVSNTNSTSTAFTNYTVSLAPYAGQEVIVGFLGTDGPIDDPESYDFHLDNINIYNVLGTDAGVTAINSPTVGGCYTATETAIVTVANFGNATISNFPVNIVVSGANTFTLTNTFTGTLAAGASATFNVGALNLATSGAYTLNAFTSLIGDANTFNNSSALALTTNPIFNINGPTQICSGSSATLIINTPPTSYTWSTGSSTVPSIVVSPTTTTTYSVLGDNGFCFAQQSITVTVTNPTISATSATVCNSTQIASLTATGFAPVNWFATPTSTTILASGNSYTASAASTTTYYAEAQQSTLSNSIQTTYTAGNGCGGGAMFDVSPNFSNMTVDSLIYLPTAAGVVTVNVYFKSGTYSGFETNSSAWTLHSSYTITSSGASVPTKVVLTSPLNLTGLTAMYVNADLRYSTGAGTFSNADMTINSGIGLCSAFGGTNNPRSFNGTLFYSKQGCTSPRVPAIISVSPNTPINVAATNSAVCSGKTSTLTASGANTYTWNTNATTPSIVVTPTATTVYTVNGLNTFNCPVSGNYTVLTLPSPSLSISPSVSLCSVTAGPLPTTTLSIAGANTYTWSNNSNLTTITVSQSVTTSYSVTGTNTSGCTNTASTTVFVVSCASLNEINGLINLSVYPNPTSGVFVIEYAGNSNKTINVVDVTGIVVYSTNTTNEKLNVNLTNIANGIYFAQITIDGKTHTVKIVKE